MSFWSTSGDTFEHGNLHPNLLYQTNFKHKSETTIWAGGGGGRGYFCICGIREHAAQMGHFFCNKSLNMGHIFSKIVPKHGSFPSDWSQILKPKISKNGYVFQEKSLKMG